MIYVIENLMATGQFPAAPLRYEKVEPGRVYPFPAAPFLYEEVGLVLVISFASSSTLFMRRRSFFLYLHFRCRCVTGEFIDHHRQVIGCSLYTLREEGVDLGPYEQNHSEVVEEKQQNNHEGYIACITAQKVCDI